MSNFFQRRSVRRYLRREVPDEKIEKILDAARWAPSAHNAQPWRFLLIKESSIKLRLAEGMAKTWIENLSSNGINETKSKELISSSIRKFTEPPVLILACLTMQDMHKYSDERREKIEYVMAIQSVASAIENILLSADLNGLSSCWFCAPLFCQDAVREILKIPTEIEPQALITIGYADEKPQPPSRKELKDIILLNYWGHGK